jgi:hypothetical protein
MTTGAVPASLVRPVTGHPVPAPGEPPRVVRVDPRDGASGVFRDAMVVARLSHPADGSSVDGESFRVEDGSGPIPARLELSPDGCVLIWRPQRALAPGVEHVVIAAGLRDRRDRELPPYESRFVTCDLSGSDLLEMA